MLTGLSEGTMVSTGFSRSTRKTDVPCRTVVRVSHATLQNLLYFEAFCSAPGRCPSRAPQMFTRLFRKPLYPQEALDAHGNEGSLPFPPGHQVCLPDCPKELWYPEESAEAQGKQRFLAGL